MRKSILFFLVVTIVTSCSIKDNPKNDIRPQKSITTDVCVYTATPSGILAALTVKEAGYSVVIIEPGRWVGGILGAGIKPIQDCPNFDAVGGKTKELMKILGTEDTTKDFTADELSKLSKSVMSPKQIRDDFLNILKKNNIEIIYDHRIQLSEKSNGKIVDTYYDYAPYDETGCPIAEPVKKINLHVKAKIYIDASYEGELMARSGVSYLTGRESEYDYSEKFAGICKPTNITPIDPFIEKGKPESGVLPLIDEDFNNKIGSGDYYTQAYNYRCYVTSDSTYKSEFECPENYSPQTYELVGRYVNYLKETTSDKDKLFEKFSRIFPGWMNDGEYNYHRNSLITMAPVGISHLYANGDYGTKAQIWKYHQNYLSGLHHFMSTDERVLQEYREYVADLGLDLRHHPDTKGWPNQLYVRVSRRLVGYYTITSHDVYNSTQINDPIALAQYGIDTYPSRRIYFKEKGQYYVGLEGNMFVGGPNGPTNIPYPIPYRAIIPKKSECTNLLVSVCFSATHQGYASARMEPVFMMVGQSAALAACVALNNNINIQDVNYQELKKKLLAANQILNYKE